jgi:hypothetical protein
VRSSISSEFWEGQIDTRFWRAHLYFIVNITLHSAGYIATNCTPSSGIQHASHTFLSIRLALFSSKLLRFPSRSLKPNHPFNVPYPMTISVQPQNPTAPPTTAAIIPIPISPNIPVTNGADALLLLVPVAPPKPPAALCFSVLVLVLVPPLPLPPSKLFKIPELIPVGSATELVFDPVPLVVTAAPVLVLETLAEVVELEVDIEVEVDGLKLSVIVTCRYTYEDKKSAFHAVANATPDTWPEQAAAEGEVMVHAMSLRSSTPGSKPDFVQGLERKKEGDVLIGRCVRLTPMCCTFSKRIHQIRTRQIAFRGRGTGYCPRCCCCVLPRKK